MKKLFLFAIAGFCFIGSSNAQVKRDAPGSQNVQSDTSHRFRKGKMMAGLNLTKDQKAQMKELHENIMQQRNAIKNDSSLTPDQKKQKMKDLHQSQITKMNAILTPEQQAKRNALMENRKQHYKMNSHHQKAVTQPAQ